MGPDDATRIYVRTYIYSYIIKTCTRKRLSRGEQRWGEEEDGVCLVAAYLYGAYIYVLSGD